MGTIETAFPCIKPVFQWWCISIVIWPCYLIGGWRLGGGGTSSLHSFTWIHFSSACISLPACLYSNTSLHISWRLVGSTPTTNDVQLLQVLLLWKVTRNQYLYVLLFNNICLKNLTHWHTYSIYEKYLFVSHAYELENIVVPCVCMSFLPFSQSLYYDWKKIVPCVCNLSLSLSLSLSFSLSLSLYIYI